MKDVAQELNGLVTLKKNENKETTTFVGIGGCPASGKTWFTQALKNYLEFQYGIKCAIISMDRYKLNQKEID